MKCMVCGSAARKFLSLGETALANSYPSEAGAEEDRFPLDVYFCSDCKAVQLGFVVPPEKLFCHYLYVTSTSNTFKRHFAKYAGDVAREFSLGSNSLVVDIGSNDGLLLKGFKKHGVSVVGVEPAANLAGLANNDGIPTINEFFSEKAVNEIISRRGNADVVTANNVFAHTTAIHDIAKSVKRLLKPEGIFIIEAAYLADMLNDMTFDAVYHEHLFYYSLTALVNLFRMDGMEVFSVSHVPSHGGSLRVFVKKQESYRAIDSSVASMLEKERHAGIGSFETYLEFAKRVGVAREKLVSLLSQLKRDGKSIAGYGAPAKATTLLSFCGIGRDVIDYVVDDSPLKQGRFIPGLKIPIVGAGMLDKRQPNYILILAWNFAPEIMRKAQKCAEKGVRFIIPFPEARVV